MPSPDWDGLDEVECAWERSGERRPRQLPLKKAPSSERRQVTALFADMVGFIAISARLGEEGTFALIQPVYELMSAAVKEQGGSVKDFTGDGIMALADANQHAPPIRPLKGRLRGDRAHGALRTAA